jgi:hypothetical protein
MKYDFNGTRIARRPTPQHRFYGLEDSSIPVLSARIALMLLYLDDRVATSVSPTSVNQRS